MPGSPAYLKASPPNARHSGESFQSIDELTATSLAATTLMRKTTPTATTRLSSLEMTRATAITTATSITTVASLMKMTSTTTTKTLTMMRTMRTHILAVTSRASKPHPMSNLELSYGLFAILTTQLAKSASSAEHEARSTLSR
jgi:hypothetical protein